MASSSLSRQNIALDETMEMVTESNKGIVADATLQRIQAFDVEIAGFREDMNRLRTPGAGIADVRRFVEAAVELQGKMNVPKELLTRDVLVQAGLPVEELEQARSLLQAVGACERLMEEARGHLEARQVETRHVETLGNFLEAFRELRLLVGKLQQQQGRSAVACVEVGLQRRQMAVSQLSEALLDKICTSHASSPNKDVLARLQHFHSQESIRQELIVLCVQVPDIAHEAPSGRSQIPLDARVVSREAPQGASSSLADAVASQALAASPVHSLEGPAFTMSSRRRDSSPSMTGRFGAESMFTLDGMASPSSPSNAQAAIHFTLDGKSAASSAQVAQTPVAMSAGDATGNGRSDFYNAGADHIRDGVPDALQATTDFAVSSKPPPGSSEWPSMAEPSAARPSSQHSTSPAVAQHQGGSQQPAAAAQHGAHPHGTPELWQAVHVGDEAVITAFIQHGACHGKMVDGSGHSVLWHAIAFSHLGIAKLVLDTFPVGHEFGVDLTEVHQRRGDTFLHLLCQSTPFQAETAHLFKRIAEESPASYLEKANAHGYTFMHFACSTLNFWVLKFAFLHLPASAKAMVCSQSSPLRAISEVIPQPAPPSFSHPGPIPEHFPLAHLLGGSGKVPFADVAFDCGPEDPSAQGDRGRFLAHRVVAGAQSSVLLEELEKIEMQDLPKEGARACVFKVDHRISKEVWRSCLQFLYTGVIACPFEMDVNRMVELLRACTMYKLPKPLLDYAQSVLFQLLPRSAPFVALQVFSLTAGSSGEDIDVRALREAATYIILRSAPQVLEAMDAPEVAKILEKVLQTVEAQVFNPAPAPSPKGILKKNSAYAAETHQQSVEDHAAYQQHQAAMQQRAAMQQHQQHAAMQQGMRGAAMYDPSMQAHPMSAAHGYMAEAAHSAAMYGGMQPARATGSWGSGNWR